MSKASVLSICGDALRIPLPDQSVDLVIGSPPYVDKRTYGRDDISRKPEAWIKWMLGVVSESVRVSKTCAIFVVCSPQQGGEYIPVCEHLQVLWRLKDVGNTVLRPLIWCKNAAPSGKNWFSNDWEFLLAFSNKGRTIYFDGEAAGDPVKYKRGGNFRQRKKDGSRQEGSEYPTHSIRKRPSNVLNVTVGGGHMGWDKATEVNEAPYPEELIRKPIRVLSQKGGLILDPFSGGGTTASVALQEGRKAIGMDIRFDQCKHLYQRINECSS